MQVSLSPNHGPRPDWVAGPDLVVIHYTAMTGETDRAVALLSDPEAEVSSHYVIGARGSLTQLVPDARRAWHAGAGSWGACDDVNSRSLGIELSNDGASPFPEPQMACLEVLLARLMRKHAIPPQNVIGHSDCAPGRKFDPGARFDWRRLARRGLSIWPSDGTAPRDEARLRSDLARAGWTADVPQDELLRTLRLRFRPWAEGPPDGRDCAIAADLAARFPVDQPGVTA